MRPLDRLESTPLAGTAEGASPFFSPDGAWLGFFADGKLKRIPLAGGAPLVIADVAEPLGAVWTREGRIIYGSSLTGGLWQVSASGGTPAPLTMPRQAEGEVRHGWPALAPDGRTLFFSIATTLDQDSPTRLAIAMLPPWVPAMAGAGTSRITTWTTPLDAVGIARPLADDLVVVARGSELQVAAIDPVTHVMARRAANRRLGRVDQRGSGSVRGLAHGVAALRDSGVHCRPRPSRLGARREHGLEFRHYRGRSPG